MNNLESVIEGVRTALEAKNTAREALIGQSRLLTQHCGKAIRAMHRQEWETARTMLGDAQRTYATMQKDAEGQPELYYAGYSQDAFKEYVEARTVFALLRENTLPTPETLGIEPATYLNGLCEAASELRRYILDIIRQGHRDEAEMLLNTMDAIYDSLMTFDFPDAVSGGLRHRVDNLRGVLERTRGDVTMSLRQQQLQAALEKSDSLLKPKA